MNFGNFTGAINQAKMFSQEIQTIKKAKSSDDDDKIINDDLDFVSSASEARLLTAPEGASLLILITFCLVVIMFFWSIFMSIDEIVKAKGKIIPSKQVQIIQSLEGGIINEINIQEGQSVKKGDKLLILNDVSATSNLSDNVQQYNSLLARLVALNTLIEGKRVLNFPKELKPFLQIISNERKRFNNEWKNNMSKIVEIEDIINQKNSDLESAKNILEISKNDYELAKEELVLNKKAYKEHLIPKVTYIKVEHKANLEKTKYKKAKNNLTQAKLSFHEHIQKRESFLSNAVKDYEHEKADIEIKLNTMKSKGVSLKETLDHSHITSPVDGVIKKLYFNTIGGVIRPGTKIVEIIPTNDKLIMEVKVKPKDIGFVHIGLKAEVKLTAFDFSTYGGLDGEVIFVSADTITDKKGMSYFLVRVKTNTNYILDKKGVQHTLIPGMQTQINILVDKKNILSYILKPLLK
jgi:adhesin transport system membrane fusion protein